MNIILREQIRLYENHISTILASNLIAASLLIIFLQPVENDNIAAGWLFAIIIFNLVRFVITIKTRKTALYTEALINERYQHYMRMVIISGLLWGITPFLLFPENSAEQQLIYLLVISIFTTSAVNLINVLPRAYSTLMALIYIPLLLMLFSRADQFSISLLTMIVIYMLFMYFTASSFRERILHAIHLQIELHKQNTTDEFTGLPNLYYLTQQLSLEWRRAMRHQRATSMLMIDLKLTARSENPDYDQQLKHFTGMLKENINRSGEFAARIDESRFAILLPDSQAKSATNLARKLSQMFKLSESINDKSQPDYHLAVKIGVACIIPQAGSDYTDLPGLAEEALLKAMKSPDQDLVFLDISRFTAIESAA
ncbi:MAG: GGDEF domain-containing protein [Gammaproteobacteria bacterium]|nr:GGDEF domain-containing protein [Gammaproteobacteria bacterium]